MPAGDRYSVSTRPLRGTRLAVAFLRSLAVAAYASSSDSWPPTEVLVEDRVAGRVVFRTVARGSTELAGLLDRLDHDLRHLDAAAFAERWSVGLVS